MTETNESLKTSFMNNPKLTNWLIIALLAFNLLFLICWCAGSSHRHKHKYRSERNSGEHGFDGYHGRFHRGDEDFQGGYRHNDHGYGHERGSCGFSEGYRHHHHGFRNGEGFRRENEGHNWEGFRNSHEHSDSLGHGEDYRHSEGRKDWMKDKK